MCQAGEWIREVTVDIEELRTFVEVANAGGVSPAARRLNVSKSIVSRRLARLEAELGVQLLARTEARLGAARWRGYRSSRTAALSTVAPLRSNVARPS